MPRKRRPKSPKRVESFRHDEAKRPNLPSAEHQSVMAVEDQLPIRAAIERRNLDLDPQLVWRGKSYNDELEVQAPPLFIQEKVHPKALVDDLRRLQAEGEEPEAQAGLFDDFNGLPSPEARTEFYQHEANWSNRMILGDALQVMGTLANREGFRGKVQCIYIDPPYGIKFNSNFQWSTTSRDVKDGKADHITREPEQVKAFRDTWRDGIHSYLSYLRDRLSIARELLTESGSVFVQIGDENVHRVRAVMDEVFREENFVGQIAFTKTTAWPAEARNALAAFWEARIARQKEIDASIAAKADFEYLYDKPYEDRAKVRVAGPFTVESLSPHRALLVDEKDNLVDTVGEARKTNGTGQDFGGMILDQLREAGVQQANREDRIEFTSLRCWPGRMIAAEGFYLEAESGEDRRAGILVGPEFGSVSRPDLVTAAREAGDAGFDVLISCAFSYDAHASEFSSLGRIPVLKARMNADLHMAENLKNTGKGNLFVIFGEPDIQILTVPPADGGPEQFQVKLNGVDVFDPATGKVRSDSADGIACWFIDTDYNGESFFVRHAYFLGANDPYKSLKTTLKAEIDREAWETLRSDTSRPFDRPGSGRIAVKVINHLGDEVMKVFRV